MAYVTRLGLIGHPLEHGLSSEMHNAVFRELGLNYVYELIDVAPSRLGRFMANEARGFSGLNVTSPFKSALFNYLDKIDDISCKIGAVNAIKIGRQVSGFNTDWVGFLRMASKNDLNIINKNALVLGAGGAARAVAYSLLKNGTSVYLSAGGSKKTLNLINHIGDHDLTYLGHSPENFPRVLSSIDLIVNATSIGMHPDVNETPISKDLLYKKPTVVDLIYNPLETRLVREARRIGCRTISGIDMLVHQGEASLRLWLGIDPPIDVMKKAVLSKLGS